MLRAVALTDVLLLPVGVAFLPLALLDIEVFLAVVCIELVAAFE